VVCSEQHTGVECCNSNNVVWLYGCSCIKCSEQHVSQVRGTVSYNNNNCHHLRHPCRRQAAVPRATLPSARAPSRQRSPRRRSARVIHDGADMPSLMFFFYFQAREGRRGAAELYAFDIGAVMIAQMLSFSFSFISRICQEDIAPGIIIASARHILIIFHNSLFLRCRPPSPAQLQLSQ